MLRGLLSVCVLAFLTACSSEEVGFSQVEGFQRASEIPAAPDIPVDPGGDEPDPLVGPEVAILEKPQNHDVSEETFAIIQVKQGSSEILSISCQVNGESLPCGVNDSVVKLEGYPVGNATFSVEVVDKNNLKDQDSASWVISATPPPARPPQVAITQQPQDHYLGEATQVRFSVTVGTEPIAVVTCQVDGQPVSCNANGGTVNLSGFQLGTHSFVVRAIDEKGFSDSAVAQWSIDPAPVPDPPVVEITSRPQDHPVGESTSVSYRVTQGTHPISQVICSVDGVARSCSVNGGSLVLSGLAVGSHQFLIRAVDSEGLNDQATAQWNVEQNYNETVTDLNVAFIEQKADILFVIDNSGSMQEEQLEVADKISNFFDKIKDINWRVGIITTDPYEFEPSNQQEDPYADGVLLPFPNGQYALNAGMNLNLARDYFAQTIFRPEQGNGHERGIRNTYRSIERYLSSSSSAKNQRLKDFYRSDATLSVVVISDENETLVNGVGAPLSDLFRSEPQELYDLVTDTWGAEKKFQWNSVVIQTGDVACLSTGNEQKYGSTYEELSRMTSGVIEDICASDYTGALNNIGAGVIDLQKVYKLECVPQDKSGNGSPDITVVSLNGNPIPSFTVSGDEIEFATALSEGQYQITYQCLD